MSKFKKGLLVVLGAIVLSTLGIQASDTLRGLDTNLTGLVRDASGPCAEGEQQILLGSHALCVDIYEASASSACPHQELRSQAQTQDNLNTTDCKPVTEADATPWTFISLTQAQQLCARAGKRLPDNEEWYRIASGMADVSMCVIDNKTSPLPTGTAGCETPAGVHDVVGNVWEWVDEEVTNGTYNGRSLPATGYVNLVDSEGVVLETSGSPAEEFGDDYAWTKADGVYGVIRGGFYGSEEDAGVFAQNLAVQFDFRTAGVGFRCVRDI